MSNIYEWQLIVDTADPWLVEYIVGMTLPELLEYQEKHEQQFQSMKKIGNPNSIQVYEKARKTIQARVSMLSYFEARKQAEKSEKEKGTVIS